MKTSKFSKKTSKKKQTGNEKERAAKDYKAKKVPFQDEQQESDSDCNLGAQKKQHDCQWKATPYINKIFSTEVPDVEESDKYNEMTSKPSGSGVKKDVRGFLIPFLYSLAVWDKTVVKLKHTNDVQCVNNNFCRKSENFVTLR